MTTNVVLLLELIMAAVILTALSQSCDVNTPEISLKELHPDCDSTSKSRNGACYAAYNRFCNQAKYLSHSDENITAVGVSREVAPNYVSVGCIEAGWAGDVTVQELQTYHSGCQLSKSQYRDCLAAIHRYCNNKLETVAGGVSTEVGSNALGVKCFKSGKKEHVPFDVLSDLLSGCEFPDSDSAHCFAAAKRWCTQFGYDGGVTQEVNTEGATVACYHAEYVGNVYLTRDSAFYQAQSQAKKVCSLDFHIDGAQILDSKDVILKSTVYDNRKARLEMNAEFDVSKELNITYRFNPQPTIILDEAIMVQSGLPYVDDDGGVFTSALPTNNIGLMDENFRIVKYTANSRTSVFPGQAITMKAIVTRADLEVDWSAKVVNGLGAIRAVAGKWTGASTFDFRVTQEDILI